MEAHLSFKWTESSLGLALLLFGGGILPIWPRRKEGKQNPGGQWESLEDEEKTDPSCRGGQPYRTVGVTEQQCRREFSGYFC